jgi:hypothetical protein
MHWTIDPASKCTAPTDVVSGGRPEKLPSKTTEAVRGKYSDPNDRETRWDFGGSTAQNLMVESD